MIGNLRVLATYCVWSRTACTWAFAETRQRRWRGGVVDGAAVRRGFLVGVGAGGGELLSRTGTSFWRMKNHRTVSNGCIRTKYRGRGRRGGSASTLIAGVGRRSCGRQSPTVVDGVVTLVHNKIRDQVRDVRKIKRKLMEVEIGAEIDEAHRNSSDTAAAVGEIASFGTGSLAAIWLGFLGQTREGYGEFIRARR